MDESKKSKRLIIWNRGSTAMGVWVQLLHELTLLVQSSFDTTANVWGEISFSEKKEKRL
jgi:hypothetical protein